MVRRGRIRPSRLNSAIAAAMGSIFTLVGLVVIAKNLFGAGPKMPAGGIAFFFLWTALSAFIAVVNLANAMGNKRFPYPGTVVEIDEPNDEASSVPVSASDRLAELQSLKDKDLISDSEFHQKRQEILQQL